MQLCNFSLENQNSKADGSVIIPGSFFGSLNGSLNLFTCYIILQIIKLNLEMLWQIMLSTVGITLIILEADYIVGLKWYANRNVLQGIASVNR